MGKKLDFDTVAEDYDFVTGLSSFSLDDYWRRFAVKRCMIGKGSEVLDVACGTGKISFMLSKEVGRKGKVTCVDVSKEMVSVAKRGLKKENGRKNIRFFVNSATKLPFNDNGFDAAIIGFGIRNINNPSKAISEMSRVVKKGGRVVILELAKPRNMFIEGFHHLYTFYVIPFFGEVFAGNREAYVYLAKTIDKFSHEESILKPMRKAGLKDIAEYSLTFGVAKVYVGVK